MFAFAEELRGRGAGLRVLSLGGGDVDTSTPMGSMLFTIMAALDDRSADAVLAEWGGSQFGPFKAALAERLVVELAPIRERYLDLHGSPEIDAVLADGAARATTLAAPTLEAAYDALGLMRG